MAFRALFSLSCFFLLAAPSPSQIVGGEVDEILVPTSTVGRIFAWGDLDQDGEEDLVVRGNGQTELLLGPAFSSMTLNPDWDWTGATVLPDLDQDGWLDVLLWNGAFGTFPNEVGRVVAVSTQTGSVLYGVTEAMGFGWSVVKVHDLDGDGLEDWATVFGVDLGTANGDFQGHLRVCSSASGATVLETAFGNPCSYPYPTDIALIGDLDGDANSDLVIGSPFESNLPAGGGSYDGAVHLASSQSGVVIRDLYSTASPGDHLGYQVEGLPDLNGDGVPDFAASSPDRQSTTGVPIAGAIEAYSGLDGSLIWGVPTDSFNYLHALGLFMGGGFDMDDDSIPDLWTTFDGETINGAGQQKAVLFVSGGTGSLLFMATPIPYPNQDEEGLGCFDFSGDGARDFVMPYRDSTGAFFLRFLSRDRWIWADNLNISLSQGGTSAIEIDFPRNARHYVYKVLVSGSGIGPMDVNGIKVPLTYDLLVLQSYLGQLPPVTSGFSGVLDSGGNAAASVDILPGSLSANLAGRSLYLAAIAGPPWEWRLSTGYLTLTLDP